ncbi:YchJ family protein [Atopomonas sediminilitoris]|uniref:YchJ family protein n=1 Tax=Atopomonas sediminilitoris TaxID=2919919 RepID=UPI001F4DB394|nr:YchJ family protein [Atopomonas sediminilitoris]MCJ8170118.1 YchJ family protein [Atopomonas sediminilitoris]
MNPNEPCPCGSQKSFAQCCASVQQQGAATPEALMRSRYSAYALGMLDYLVATTLPAQQAGLDQPAMQQWSTQSQWLGLTVLASGDQADSTPARGWVRFQVRWQEPQGEAQSHEELSHFVRGADQRWYFIDPTVPLKLERNAHCPCGSARKVKKCCGPYLGA